MGRQLQGSERRPVAGARAVGPADPTELIEITVRVRGARAVDLVTHRTFGRPMTHDEIEEHFGASAEDLAKVEEFAHARGFGIATSSAAERRVVVSGPAGALAEAFGIKLERFRGPRGDYRGRTGAVQIPEELEGVVTGVFGFDDRPQASPHLRRVKTLTPRTVGRLSPVEVARLYHFPDVDAHGQTIALIELGGGYRSNDIAGYFRRLGVRPPKIVTVSVDGGKNHPSSPNSADAEVALDIEVAGAAAPGAKIVVYFAPNTDRGFLDALTTAIHDRTHKPSVVSISWGSPECRWTQQAMDAFDEACQTAALLGVTVCAAAGDAGSADMQSTDPDFDDRAHVDFPASSPHVLACGGTRLDATDGSIKAESVWNDGPDSATGGGVSDVFPLPLWQADAKVPCSANPDRRVGRGVPDVAGNADPESGYEVRVDGVDTSIGGTSAVAPLWAGFIALVNQKLGRPIGFVNPLLYKLKSGFRDVSTGDNGHYSACHGWDPCTGLGSPDLGLAGLLIGALTVAQAA